MITRKDGKPYRISGPNPLMNDQEIWDGSYVLHNFDKFDVITKSIKKESKPAQEIVNTPPETPIPSVSLEEDFFCLPAVSNVVKDPLYNEDIIKLSYGQPYKFKCKVLKQSDLGIIVQSDRQQERNSILYQVDMKRWWKVIKSQDNIVECIISDIQPHFANVS